MIKLNKWDYTACQRKLSISEGRDGKNSEGAEREIVGGWWYLLLHGVSRHVIFEIGTET